MNRILPIVAIASLAGSASAQLSLNVMSPPFGSTAAVLESMTPDGSSAVGFAQTPAGTTRPVRWSASNGLNFLSDNGNWHDSGAQCVSPDGGTIFGYMRFSDLRYKMVSWINFIRTEYVNLPAGITEFCPQAMDSAAANIFGWVTQPGTDIKAARMKPNGQWVLLNQTFPNNTVAARSYVADVSDNGLIATGNSWIEDVSHPVRWILTPNGASTMQELGALVAGHAAYANAASSDGSVIVGRGSTAGSDRAWQWRSATGMVALENLPGDGFAGAANISSNARVVVGYANVGGSYRPRFWINGEVHDLLEYMQDRGINMSGWSSASLSGVNNDGSIVTGNGTLNGNARTFVAHIRCNADLDFDGNVDLADFFAFFNAFDTSANAADVTADGIVDLNDFFDFLNHFDTGC